MIEFLEGLTHSGFRHALPLPRGLFDHLAKTGRIALGLDALIALGLVKKVGEDKYIATEVLKEREQEPKIEPPSRG